MGPVWRQNPICTCKLHGISQDELLNLLYYVQSRILYIYLGYGVSVIFTPHACRMSTVSIGFLKVFHDPYW